MLKKLLLAIVRPSSFKLGLLVTMAACILYLFGGKTFNDGVRSIDNRIVDWMFLTRGPGKKVTDDVVIVDLDEKSLAEIGQWPWARTTFADLLLKVGACEPKSIGLDIVFPENDRASPKNYVDYFKDKGLFAPDVEFSEDAMDNDLALGEAIADLPMLVLGYVFDDLNDPSDKKDSPKRIDETPFPMCNVKRVGPEEAPFEFVWARDVILNIGEISAGAATEGFFNTLPDKDGTMRKVPLFIELFSEVGSVEYPSLALEMLRAGMGEQGVKIVAGLAGILGVQLGDHFIPTDFQANAFLNCRGDKLTFNYVSACDVLAQRLPKETLQGKYVLVGTSAAGLHDLRTTPLAPVIPGVEIHATLIDNVLQNDSFRYDAKKEAGLVLVSMAVSGTILAAALSFAGPVVGGVSALVFLAGVVFGDYYLFFLRNEVVGISFPLALLLAVSLVVSVSNYFFEGRAKRVIRGMFSTMVSGDVLTYMEAHPGSFSLAGEARHATMFFSDVAGFTTISESLTPEDLVMLLNAYLTPMTEIIMDRRGYVDKYEGDAIMAEWGVPFPCEDHAQLACFAALEQQRHLAQIREELYKRFGHQLFVRMGMNSGTVSAGNMGSTRRFSYTVMGDAVNQAARFEPANKDYSTDIMIGATTYELAKNDIEARLLDTIIVKGKTQPIEIDELIAKKGEITPDKTKVASLYVDALRTHWERRFDEAVAGLQEALRIDPEDGPAKALLTRINGYQAEPPPDSWQGEYIRASKD